MRDVLTNIQNRFEGKIRLRMIQNADAESVGDWFRNLRDAAITRWWNDLASDSERTLPTPAEILRALKQNELSAVSVSERLAPRFREVLTAEKRAELFALRPDDRYMLELHVGPADNDYREMSRLSGGQRVSILLSLLLESDDMAPLVIDQPEDELDSAYLFDTVLPALRRLKGRRQIVFATHSANIVVNGDADQVVFLSASADRGQVESQGAIEQAHVRDAILRAVDGGQAAFQMRYAKYGF